MPRIVLLSFCCIVLFPVVVVFGWGVVSDVARAIHGSGGWGDAFETLVGFSIFAIIAGQTFKLLLDAIKAYRSQSQEGPPGFPVVLKPPTGERKDVAE